MPLSFFDFYLTILEGIPFENACNTLRSKGFGYAELASSVKHR
jgi:hypothetical protein